MRVSRAGFGVMAATLVVAVLAGCSAGVTSSAAPTPKGDAPAASVPVLPACSGAVMANTQGYINTFTKDRIAAEGIPAGWDGKSRLADDAKSVAVLAKAAMLPCEPAISLTDAASNPPNVQTISSIMSQELWAKLVLANKVGAGEAPAPLPTGFANSADSYRSFLRVAARFPYFCGEQGIWPSVAAACQRELATVFAHAIQETGEKPVPAGEEFWQTSLFNTRELTCYPNNCTAYNTGAADYGAPSTAGFYGRGMKQLSYVTNYAAFSATYFGDIKVLVNNPDLVSATADLVLGSGIWFAMSPQVPKPSMHDVVIGLYQPSSIPTSGVLGVFTDQDGSVREKFAATVNLINGAVECSPENGQGTSAEKALNLQRSQNRFSNYVALLGVFGVTESMRTAAEQAIVPGTTYCTIANGPAFDDTGALLVRRRACRIGPDRTCGGAADLRRLLQDEDLGAGGGGLDRRCHARAAGAHDDQVKRVWDRDHRRAISLRRWSGCS